MSTDHTMFNRLIVKYICQALSSTEQAELNTFLLDEANRRFFSRITAKDYLGQQMEIFERIAMRAEHDWQLLLQRASITEDAFDESDTVEIVLEDNREFGHIKAKRIIAWGKLAAAAAVILVVSVGGFFLFNSRNGKKDVSVVTKITAVSDIKPGGSRARLILADGREIVLDSAFNGQIVKEGSFVVSSKEGKLQYTVADDKKSGEVLYNTLITGNGETYQVELSDGTKVWLNAASSIRYPVGFAGVDRKVIITGEAYFDVANSLMPFIASTKNGTEVNVMATGFNINAYEDEEVLKVTLVKGKILVKANGASSLLKPGQQASIHNSVKNNGMQQAGKMEVSEADLSKVIAWKNGLFYFSRDDIRTVMRQISRWYDVEVVYKVPVHQVTFSGKIYKYSNLSEVLKILKENDLHFKLGNKKLIETD